MHIKFEDLRSDNRVQLMAEFLGIISEMESGVKEFTHNETFTGLGFDLISSEGLEHDEGVKGDKSSSVHPDGKNSSSHLVNTVVFLQVKHVHGGQRRAEEKADFCDSLGVIHSVDDSLVLLPVVVIHSK